MKIPEEKQYEYFTSHLQYINEKIYHSFTLFIKLATTIVGGVFFIHWKLSPEDAMSASIGNAANLLFGMVSFSMGILILNNLRAWCGYRERLCDQYPEIPQSKYFFRWLTEIVMSAVIVITNYGFIKFNPL